MSWKRVFLEHPRLRGDGIYVSRNSYVRPGVTDLANRKGHAHMMVYFRYYRFFGNGRFFYKTSPLRPCEIVEQFQVDRGRGSSQHHGRRKAPNENVDRLHEGAFLLSSSRVMTQISYRYEYGNETVITTRLALRSTVPGANNRLDIISINSSNSADRYGGNLIVNDGGEGDIESEREEGNRGDHDDDERTTIRHSRGLNTYIFVPFLYINETPLNLPPSEMDFFLPG